MHAGTPHLTGRKLGILGSLAGGQGVPAIALGLGVTPRAVRGQPTASYRALSLGDVASKRPAAVAWYLREGYRYHAWAK